ncbi:MAG: general secretion pathway protein GspD [Undibacterium sp.]|nr:general secretion pathway protein GspD [Undibacterium sp.]
MTQKNIPTTLKFFKSLLLLMIILGLTACAAQMAFREGKDLIAQNNVEEGLSKLKFASTSSPDNIEFRKVYLQAREQTIYSLVEQAEQANVDGKFELARKLYQKIARIEPGNAQAKAGVIKVGVDERNATLVGEAISAIEKKEYPQARQLLTEILANDSYHAKAKQLLASIADTSSHKQQEAKLQNSYKKSINIEFKDAPLKQVFEVISRSSGLNFIFDKDVKTDQRTSIFLKNSSIESAIQFALITNQLGQQVLDGNTILIYPNTAAKQKDYQEMIVRSFYLTNADVKKVEHTLKTIVKTRDIVIDEKLNMLIMRDTPEAIRMAEKLVALHDIAEPEVMLEVEILEVKRTRLLDLGIQWPNSLSLTPLTGVQGASLTLQNLRNNINSSTLGAAIGPASIKARKEDGDTNLLANPRIRAQNHEKAHVLIGERVPNITTTSTSTGFVSESINYIEVGLKLDVEPTVYLDNDVGIKVALEVSSITNQTKTQSGSVAYQIGTRNASTVLRLKNGETQILAGLINDEERQSASKIPGLGELPLIGRLFGSNVNDNQKTEIILSITPHLIRNIQVPDSSATSFSSGTESNLRIRGDQTELSNYTSKLGTSTVADIPKSDKAGMGASTPNVNGTGSGAVGNGAGVVNNVVGAPQLQWQGPRQVKIGETFSLQLITQSDQPVTSMPMKLGFNPQVLQVVNVNEGIFLKQGGAQTTFVQQVDPKGIISISNSRALGGASSPGGYVTLVLRALAPIESTPIQMLSIDALGMAGRPLAAPQVQAITIEIQP